VDFVNAGPALPETVVVHTSKREKPVIVIGLLIGGIVVLPLTSKTPIAAGRSAARTDQRSSGANHE